MAVLPSTNPTLLDLAKMTDPDGSIATIAEILNETNEILDDMTWIHGNLPTGHRTTMRAGIPLPTWRKLYGGVQPNKGTTVQITDSCGMLEAYAEIDKALADLSGNTSAFRLAEDKAHIEGMSQEVANALFWADEATAPEKFTGFAPRYNATATATNPPPNGENVLDGGGTGSTNWSIWLVVWGTNTVHGIVPKGSNAGLKMTDKGQVTVENATDYGGTTPTPALGGGRFEAYRTHYRWDVGLCVRDWRYVVRIANIDRTTLLTTAATGANLTDLMVQAEELIPNLNAGRPVWYVNRSIKTWLRRQLIEKTKSSTLTQENQAGKLVTYFDGIPIKRVDALAVNEAKVPTT
jgi:hypothetical protein